MSKAFKIIFLSVFYLLFVSGLFLLPDLIGHTPKAEATFGSCSPVYLDNTTNLASASYSSGDEAIWNKPVVQIIPTSGKVNNFNVTYSQDPLLSEEINCSWSGGLTAGDLICPANNFIAGMQWQFGSSGTNNRNIYCCGDDALQAVASAAQWEVPYNTLDAANCAVDVNGVAKPGGAMIGLKNDGNVSNNNGLAVCQQFSKNPIDLRVTLSCGVLGPGTTDWDAGKVTCTGKIKNYGCDLVSHVFFDRYNGLGAVFFTNVENAEGQRIGTGVTMSDVLETEGGWRWGRKCEAAIDKSAVNYSYGGGQSISCNFTYLDEEEHFITFCARGGTAASPGGGEAAFTDNCATARVTSNFPDLVVHSVTCPECTKQGDYNFLPLSASFNLKAIVKNQGPSASPAVSGSYRPLVFAIGYTRQCYLGLGALASGATANSDPNGNLFQCGLTFPANFPAGTAKWVDYRVCVDQSGDLGSPQAIYNSSCGDVRESGGSGFTRDSDASNCQTFRIGASLPNLLVHTFEGLTPVPVGISQNLRVKVENQGASGSGATTVRVYKTSPGTQERVCEFNLPTLGAAGSGTAVSETFSCPFTFSQKAVYNFQVRIDEDGLVEEINDDDNNFSLQVTADYPDLTVPELNCFPGTPSSPGTPGAPITNENFFCSAKVKNIGQAPILENLADGIVFYSVDGSTLNPISRCTTNLIADDVSPGSNGQLVSCVFSGSSATPALAMDKMKVCVDPAETGGIGRINENGQDGEASNCQEVGLTFQIPNLQPENFTCKSCTGNTCSNCLAGIAGSGVDWRVTEGVTLKFAAQSKNISSFNMPQSKTLIRGMVYYLDDTEKCNFNLGPLNAGQTSGYVPSQETEWCKVQNINRTDHAGLNQLKACVDPVSPNKPLGELFEENDSDQDNCFERTFAIASPNLTATLNCPATVSRDTPFSCTATINNTTDIAMAAAINSPQGIVFWLDGTEVSSCKFGLPALGANGTLSQNCSLTFSDNLPHTIKVCGDPKDKQPPYGAQFEEDDSNASNCAESTAIVAVPDFVIQSYTFSCPNVIVKSQDFTCSLKVKNANTGATYTTAVPIAFFVQDVEKNRISYVFTSTAVKVTSGAMRIDTIPASGVANITVYLDPDNGVYESNVRGHDDAENNNSLMLENIPVVEALLPDFTILDGSVKCYDQDLLVKTGEPFACEAKIKNIGYIKPASNFYTLFYSGWGENSFLGAEFVDINVVPLNPGQNHTVVPVNLTFASPGDYPIVVCADRSVSPSSNLYLAPGSAPGVIQEINETNNCLEGPTIKAVDQLLADLSIADNEAGCSASAVGIGQSFSCTATVRNIGHVNSPALPSTSNNSKGVVMYVDGLVYNPANRPDFNPRALNALTAGTGSQQFRWDNLVINDDGGTFPRDVTIEFCVDHPFPGIVPEYDDAATTRNNCQDVVLQVLREDATVAEMSLSTSTITAGQGVDITVSATDTQNVVKLGVNLCFTTGCPWEIYNCPAGAVSCEKTWTYTPNWSGKTRTIRGYARGTTLDGKSEVVYPTAELTVLSGTGGGEVSFNVKGPSPASAPIARAKIMVYELANSALVGDCTTDSAGVCAIDIADWSKEYSIVAQSYGWLDLSLSPHTFQSFTQALTMSPTTAAKVLVRFQIIEAGTEAAPVFVQNATVKVSALSGSSTVAEFTTSTGANGSCSFELYRSQEEDKSYRATVLHPDYLDASFEFDIADGSTGEAYQIPLERSLATQEITFKVIDEATRAVVADATVEIVGIGSRLTVTDGRCIFDLVPGAQYDIRVTAAGYYDFAWDDYTAQVGEQTLQIGARQPQGPSATSTTITAAIGGYVMNEVSAGVGAGASVPANALPTGVASAELTIEPIRTTAGAAAAAMSAVPRGLLVIGSYVYDYSVTAGVTFNPAVTISLTYTDGQLSGYQEGLLKIYYYDEASSTSSAWRALPTTVNTNTNTATASVSHFTVFVLMLPSCYDSDGAQDKNSLGVVNYGADEYPDACRDDNTLRQYQCNGVNFDPAVNFQDSDCAGLGCTNGVCRSADDRVGVVFQIIEAGTVNPVLGTRVYARNVSTQQEESSCETQEEGKCAISLAIGSEYQVKIVDESNYHEDIDYGSIENINPLLDESQPVIIEMIAVPLESFTTPLCRGWNLIACPTVEPLTWNELTSGCRMADSANDDNNEGDDEMAGFLLYGFYGQWMLREPERPLLSDEVAYVYLDEESCCSVHKVGRKDTSYYQSLHVGGEDPGVNFFSVPDFMSFRGIQNDCEEGYIEDNILYTRDNTTDAFPSVGLDATLDPFRGYIIKINEYCTLKH